MEIRWQDVLEDFRNRPYVLRDRPAAIGLEVVKKLVAEGGRDIDGDAVDMIKRDYVDDGFGGGNDDDVRRLMGEVEKDDGTLEYRGTVAQIMEREASSSST